MILNPICELQLMLCCYTNHSHICFSLLSKAVPSTCHGGACSEERYSSYSFSNLALDEVSGKHHVPAVLYPQERSPSTHWIGGWVGLRASLDTWARMRILYPCQGLNPGCPVYGQTLYWLNYPSSIVRFNNMKFQLDMVRWWFKT
jgi:hypothetical protein